MLDVSGMMQEDFLPQRLVVHVGIDLRCAEVSMSEQFLDDAQIGSALEQSRREGVAECVRRDRLLDTRSLSLTLHHDQNHRTREVMPASVEKDIVLLAGLDFHLPPVVEPQLQLMDGALRDGHQSLLAAFTVDADEALRQEEVAKFEIGEFRDTQSTGEKDFDDGAVAVVRSILFSKASTSSVDRYSGKCCGR